MIRQTRIKYIIAVAVLLFLLGKSAIGLTLTLVPDTSVDFGRMNINDKKQLNSNHVDTYAYCNRLDVYSDIPSQWTVRVDIDSPLTNLTFPAVTLPIDCLQWMATYAGFWKNSSWHPHTSGLVPIGFKPFSLGGDLVYTSGTSDPSDPNPANDNSHESPESPTQIQFIYLISIPDNQTAGTYTGYIKYTVYQ